MGAYLTDHPPVRDQFRERTYWKRHTITGCTVAHTTESIMDTVGPDTGAEAVAEWIRRRTDPGSYHDLVDSDTGITLVPYHLGAYQDGSGSNGWATSLAFACKTTDWAKMPPAKRRGFLRQGALKFAAQQLWRKAAGHPLTRLRRITRAQSEAGESGVIAHGDRDPDRRTDPGIEPPHLFPWAELFTECRIALAELMPDHPDAGPPQEDDMPTAAEIAKAVWDHRVTYGGADAAARLVLGDVFHHARRAAGLAAQAATVDVDEAALARELAPLLTPAVVEALGQDRGLTQEQVEAAIRRVLGSLDA
jgi:hypothetical protein